MLDRKLGFLVHQDAKDAEVIVRPLGTINHRSPLHSDSSPVCHDLRIGFDRTRFHIEMHLYDIPFFPLAGD